MKNRPLVILCLVYLTCLILILAVFPRAGDAVFHISSSIQRIQNIVIAGDHSFLVKITRIEETSHGLEAEAILYETNGKKTGYRCRIQFRALNEEISEGDQLRISGTVKWPERATNPGQWDALSYARSQGYWMTILAEKTVILIPHSMLNPSSLLGKVRRYLSKMIDFCYDEDTAGLVKAMLLGDKSGLSAEDKDLFSAAGISHITAISGLHLTILVSILERIIGKRWGPVISSGLLSVLLWAYIWMTGFSSSTFRAGVMITYQLFAVLLDREPDRPTSLALAALLQLLIRPFIILGASFWLTYLAVIGLWIGRSFALRLIFLPRLFREKAAGSLGVALTTFPISLWFFFQASFGSFFLNLFVVPITRYLLLFSMAGLGLDLIHPSLGEGFAFVGSRLVQMLYTVSDRMNGIPGLHLFGRPSVLIMFLFSSAILLYLLSFRYFKRRKRRMVMLVMMVLLILVSLFPRRRVMFLDVGQGDCSVIEWDERVIVIDAGPSYTRVIQPYLKYEGIGKADVLILSHPDQDHIEGMIQMLEDGLKADVLLIADVDSQDNDARRRLISLTESSGGKVIRCLKNDFFELETLFSTISFKVLSPEGSTGKANEDSLVVEISLGEDLRVLYTGDIGQETDRTIHISDKRSPVILKAAHHGSMYGTSRTFLQEINPALAVISAGRNNEYGHPHEQMLQRLYDEQIPFWVTAENGAIFIDDWIGHLYFRYYYSNIEQDEYKR